MKEQLYWINLSYACFGIIVKNNKVVETAPIGKWMIKKDISFIVNWIKKKKGEIKNIS